MGLSAVLLIKLVYVHIKEVWTISPTGLLFTFNHNQLFFFFFTEQVSYIQQPAPYVIHYQGNYILNLVFTLYFFPVWDLEFKCLDREHFPQKQLCFCTLMREHLHWCDSIWCYGFAHKKGGYHLPFSTPGCTEVL